MVITYNKSYGESRKGIDWILYQDLKFKDSLIIWNLFNFVKANTGMTFDNLYESLKIQYKNKTVKSRCVIECDENRIEILTKGTFPRFYITRKTD